MPDLSMSALDHARRLRRKLYGIAEPSGHEEKTAEAICAFLDENGISYQTGIGGHGVLATVGDGGDTLLRADLDGIPDQTGTAHRCGHDGHMAMLAGVLPIIKESGGAVTVLFQPSEEDGSGMARCLEDPRVSELNVSRCFSIHNVPGEPMGQIVLGPGALASTGLRLTFTGRESHAATPDDAVSPYADMHRIASLAEGLRDGQGPHALATLIHVRLGQEAYGTSPGRGIVSFTLRGSDDDVDAMRDKLMQALDECAVDVTVEHVDPFPETSNDAAACDAVRQAARKARLDVADRASPFPWSEDFGHAVHKWSGALIGLGSGTDQPPLHDDDFEFPDELLEHGIRLWEALI